MTPWGRLGSSKIEKVIEKRNKEQVGYKFIVVVMLWLFIVWVIQC